MVENSVHTYLDQRREDLASILQNQPLDESGLIRFARDRGFEISGVVTGDPSRLLDLGWLDSDGSPDSDRPLFHPFRVYPIYRVLETSKLHITATSSLCRDTFPELLADVARGLPSLDRIAEYAALANEIADLAILLEPLYWPNITSHIRWNSFTPREEHERLVAVHKDQVAQLVGTLDIEEWRKRHEHLRFAASGLDDNGDLYILLRLAPWSKRERLKGRIAGALWIRHMAEVLRRGFSEFCDVDWPEEDQSHGIWFPGARERIYGSDYPLSDPLTAKPKVAFEFGLHTGSTVRWYLEGETEYHATLTVLPRAAAGGIELVNLRGALGDERGNTALRLADALQQDQELRRFSFISFDMDVPANIRAVGGQVADGKVIGYVNANTPDFEFGNFTLDELVEVAARFDEAHEVSGNALRTGDWTGVDNGRRFETRYCDLSIRQPRGLKGEGWGVALAEFAMANPRSPGTDMNRPFLQSVDQAIRSRRVVYEDQRDRFLIEPDSFRIVRRPDVTS